MPNLKALSPRLAVRPHPLRLVSTCLVLWLSLKPTNKALPVCRLRLACSNTVRFKENGEFYSQCIFTVHCLLAMSLICCHQVVRYSALLTGIFYGVAHQRTLQREKDEKDQQHAIHNRELLIKKAKDAWKQKQSAAKDSCEFRFFDLSLLPLWYSYPCLVLTLDILKVCICSHHFLVVTDPEDPNLVNSIHAGLVFERSQGIQSFGV